MNAIDKYFKLGLSISLIAEEEGVNPKEIRSRLRNEGISIPVGAELDVVTEALQDRGYTSFHDFVTKNGFYAPIKDQAKELEVSRHVLGKLYEAYRTYVSDSAT